MSLEGVFIQPKGESTELTCSEDSGCPVRVADVGFMKRVRVGFQQD